MGKNLRIFTDLTFGCMHDKDSFLEEFVHLRRGKYFIEKYSKLWNKREEEDERPRNVIATR